MVTLYRLSERLSGAFPAGMANPAPRFVFAWTKGTAPDQTDLASAADAGIFAFLSAKKAVEAAQKGEAGWNALADDIGTLAPARCCWLGATSAVPGIQTDSDGIVKNAPIFKISEHLTIGVQPGTRFGVDPNGNGLTIAVNGVAEGLTLKPRQIGSDEFGAPVPLSRSLLLSVGQNSAEDQTGQFQFAVDATDAILADLNLDLRYFRAAEESLPGQTIVNAVKAPVFALEGTPAILVANLDPLGNRDTPSSLGWFELKHTDGQSALPTNFTTVHGHRVHLASQPDAKIVFSRTVQVLDTANNQAPDQALSLTLSGSHEMRVPTDPAPGEHYLIAGNRGTELLPFNAADMLEFAPGNPAFDATSVAGSPPLPAERLNDLGHTAWLAVRRAGNAGMDYIVQSQDAPLRGPAPHGTLAFNDGRRNILATVQKPHVPMLPLPALGAALDRYMDAVDLETAVIAPHRLTVMRGNLAPSMQTAATAMSSAAMTMTSPQGFLVEAIDGEWQSVTIGLSESPDAPRLVLRRPDASAGRRWVVQDALEQRAVFLVVTGVDTALELGTADLSIAVCGWDFAFELPGWPATKPSKITFGHESPILIIKFSDRPITTLGHDDPTRPALISDLKAWTMPNVFSDGPTGQATLQERIAGIVHASNSGDPTTSQSFAALVRRLTDPSWNGVMMLGPTMTAPPDGIAAIRAGLPLDIPLQAVCIGVDANKIVVTPAQDGGPSAGIALRSSSVFGLVSYTPSGPAASPPSWVPEDDGIAFQVTKLLLQIENSEVVCFACDARLRLPSFLGGVATTNDQTDKAMIELHGQYEKRASGPGVFLLSSDVTRDGNMLPPIDFQDVSSGVVPALKRLTVTRIQLVCSLAAGQTDQFVCGFTITGKLDFYPFPRDFPAIAITGLAFDKATVRLTFGLDDQNRVVGTKYDIDIGSLRLTIDQDAQLGSGLLSKLPFRLNAFHFSGFRPRLDTPPLDIGSLGMVEFGFGALNVLDKFDFGLEFSLDLGSPGGLVSGLRTLSASIVIGWPDFRRYLTGNGAPPSWPPTKLPLCIGFRIDGGGGALDLGVEGILQISAKSVKLHSGQDGIAIMLKNCQVDVLGQTLPDSGAELDFFIYLPSNAPDRPAWFGAYSGEAHIGPITVTQLTVAQRLKMFNDGVPYATADAIDRISGLGIITDPSELLGKAVSYDAHAGWSFGLSCKFSDVVAIDAVLADPVPLYGLRVAIPSDGTLFTIDALYTRVADDIGVFSAEITPPSAFQRIFLGPVEIDIGNLGLQVFSDGSWTFDLGFPSGLDFTRSFVAQIGPFIGFGGMYVASRDARTTTLLAGKDCQRVLEMGVAARVGLGREIQAGPLSAGASITVFGILEGAFGVRAAGGPVVHLIGQFGVIAEVYGYVNFAIVRAAVSVRAWADVTINLETGEPIILSIDAGVSVRVSIVIGHIHFWRVNIEIRISFSFDTRLHFSWTLGAKDGHDTRTAALLFTAEPAPLQWIPATVFDTPIPLELVVALDASVRFLDAGRAEAVMIFLLCAPDTKTGSETEPALADLLEGLLRWTLTGAGYGQPGEVVPDAVLDTIWTAMSLSDSLNRLGPAPLALPSIAQFLKQNFKIKVNIPEAADAPEASNTGVLIPMIPDIAVSLTMPGGATNTIDFGSLADAGATLCDDAYEARLDEWFARQAGFTADAPKSTLFAAAKDTRTATTVMFEDWIGHLVKQIFGNLQQLRHGQVAPPAVTVNDLVETIRGQTQHITGLAARMLTCGLRVPASAPSAGTKALYELTQQQQPAIPGNPDSASNYTLAFTAARGADWFTVGAAATNAPILVDAARQLAALAGHLPVPEVNVEQEPPVVVWPAVSTATEPILTTINAEKRTIWTLPVSLLTQFSQRGPNPIRVNLSIPPASNMPGPGTAVPPPLQWATKIDFGLRQVFGVDPTTGARSATRGLYQVVGANKANRDIIKELVDSQLGSAQGMILIRRNDETVIDTLVTGDAVLVKTNFSTEPMPPDVATTALAAATPSKATSSADINEDLPSFLSLLFECSVVNGTGFWLRYWPAAGDLSGLFAPDASGASPTSVSISLIVVHTALTTEELRPQVNALITGAVTVNAIQIAQPDIPTAHTAFKQGNVVLNVRRPNPDPNPGTDPLATLAARYSLLVCSAPAVPDIFFALDPNAYIPTPPIRKEPLDITSSPRTRPQLESDQTTWFYRVEVPFWRFAIANNDNQHDCHLVADPDPYIGVGQTSLNLTLSWRDLYGNDHVGGDKLVDHVRIDYCDLLKAPGEWPRMSIAWLPGDTTDTVSVTFTFQGYALPSDESGEWVAPYYRQLFHQLNQPDVTAILTAGVASRFDIKAQLVRFIDGIKPDSSGKMLPPASLPLQVPATFIDDGVVLPTRAQVELKIERNKALVTSVGNSSAADIDPRFARVVMDIAPDIEHFKQSKQDSGNAIAWLGFATAFEKAYPALRFLKALDTSTSTLTATASTATGPAYCAPRALLAPVSKSGASAITFAPTPLSRSLLSGTVKLPFGDLIPGADVPDNGPTVQVSDVDLDALAARYLTLIEQLLSPTGSVNLRRADANAFEVIAAAKASIAQNLSERLRTVVSGEDEQGLLVSAKAAFRNRVRADLSAAYRIGAVVALPCEPIGNDPAQVARLLGAPNITGAPGIKLLPAKLDRASADHHPILTFVIEWEQRTSGANPTNDAASSAAGTLEFAVKFVERPAPAFDQAGDEYVPSEWFQPLTPISPISFGAIDIPLPLRAYPVRPKLMLQSSVDPNTFAKQRHESLPTLAMVADRVSAMRRWHYAMDLTHDLAPERDQLDLVVTYGTVAHSASLSETQRTVFDALVSFDTLWSTLGPRLTQLVSLGLNDPAVTGFAADARQLAWLFHDLASALKRPFASASTLAVAPTMADQGNITQKPDGSLLAVLRPQNQIAHELIAYMPGADPWAIFDPPQPSNVPGTPVIAKPTTGPSKPGIRPMRAILSHLDVLVQQTASATFQLTRNATLGTRPIVDDFVYRTEPTSFPNRFIPNVRDDARLNLVDGSAARGAPLSEYLRGFFEALFKGTASDLAVSIATSLATPLTPMAEPNKTPTGPQWATYPLPALPPTPVQNFGADIASTLSAQIEQAFQVRKPAIRRDLPKPEIRFEIIVFGETDVTQIPLLTLPNVYIAVDAFSMPSKNAE